MNQSTAIKCLIQVLGERGVDFEIQHRDNNLVAVTLNDTIYHFSYTKVPLNDAVVSEICKDKEYTYSVLKNVIKMPDTKGYVDPHITEAFQDYVRYETNSDVAKNIISEFDLPIIIKPNKGSGGINAFLCTEETQIVTALDTIFNQNSKNYDYVALVQKYIDIKHEYRVLVLDSEIQFIYEKDKASATFEGNLSPLHYEGAKAVLIKNEELKNKIKDFISPIFKKINLRYTGADIAIDSNGDMYLIELNGNPQVDIFVRDNGMGEVVAMFRNIVSKLENRNMKFERNQN